MDNSPRATGGVAASRAISSPISIASLLQSPLPPTQHPQPRPQQGQQPVMVAPGPGTAGAAGRSATQTTRSGDTSTQQARAAAPVSAANNSQQQRQPVRTVSCMNCKTTSTPLWRRDPTSGAHLCNRCGLYLKTYNVMHPLTKTKRRPMNTTAAAKKKQEPAPAAATGGDIEMDDVEMIPRPANCHPPQLKQVVRRRVTPKQQISQGITPKCFNCGVEHTPLWRRDTEGNVICNACGLYYKLHEKVRPVSMKRAVIKRRNRTAVQHHHQVSSSSVSSLSSSATLVRSSPVADCEMAGVDGFCLAASDKMAVDGLEALMRAAELSPQQPLMASPKGAAEQRHGPNYSMLESLATVATAQISASKDGGYMQQPHTALSLRHLSPSVSVDDDEILPPGDKASTAKPSVEVAEYRVQLQRECQRLEELLARSTAILHSLE